MKVCNCISVWKVSLYRDDSFMLRYVETEVVIFYVVYNIVNFRYNFFIVTEYSDLIVYLEIGVVEILMKEKLDAQDSVSF